MTDLQILFLGISMWSDFKQEKKRVSYSGENLNNQRFHSNKHKSKGGREHH